MLRWFVVVAGALACFALSGEPAWAQAAGGGWPANPAAFARGPGYYFSLWKLLLLIALVLLWIRTTDWISQDCILNKLNYALWNPIVFFSFLSALVVFWIVPLFAIGYLLLLIAYVAPLAVFIVKRNQQVPLPEKVLTKPHLRQYVATRLAKIGIQIESETKAAHELGAQVDFKPIGAASERDNNVNLLTARQSPGYVPAKDLMFDAVERRADAVMLDYGAQVVNVRYQIDGIWHNLAPQERVNADPLLAVLKMLAALNPNERRARQEGSIPVETQGRKVTCKITSQGVQTGERVVLQIIPKKPPFDHLEDLGMRPKMQEKLLELLGTREGAFWVVSSIPGGGLTTTVDALLQTIDRYVRNFAAVEDIHKPERDLENVPVTTYDSKAGESPVTVLPKLIRTYPDVIVVRDMVDAETVSMLCEQAGERRLIITTMRAKEAVEALLRVLLLKVPPAEFAPAASGVLNMRLVRKLCDTCKEAYRPGTDVLRQLGLPAGRVEAFYRPPTAPAEPDKICPDCKGIGYRGRTAIFELLVVEDSIREVLANSPKLELLRDAARKAKHRTLQEEGVLLVARGVTSLPELMRVLKQ